MKKLAFAALTALTLATPAVAQVADVPKWEQFPVMGFVCKEPIQVTPNYYVVINPPQDALTVFYIGGDKKELFGTFPITDHSIGPARQTDRYGHDTYVPHLYHALVMHGGLLVWSPDQHHPSDASFAMPSGSFLPPDFNYTCTRDDSKLKD
jgi:hypothetical protein